MLAGRLVAAKLNVGIAGTPGSFHLVGCVVQPRIGLTINQLIAIADTAVAGSGTPAGVSLSNINDALDTVNGSFDGCSPNGACVGP